MDQDKKQYTDMLKLLGHTGSGVKALNCLNTIEIVSSDQKLKLAAQNIARLIRETPEYFHRTKLNLQAEAGRSGGMTEHQRDLKEWVEETKKYCEKLLATVEPDWITQARTHGWKPPAP